jgi:hypothetical protein
MSDSPNGSPPDIRVSMTKSGSKITPHRVTVTENRQVVRQVDFGLMSDAKRMFDLEKAAIKSSRQNSPFGTSSPGHGDI